MRVVRTSVDLHIVVAERKGLGARRGEFRQRAREEARDRVQDPGLADAVHARQHSHTLVEGEVELVEPSEVCEGEPFDDHGISSGRARPVTAAETSARRCSLNNASDSRSAASTSPILSFLRRQHSEDGALLVVWRNRYR